MRADPPWAFVHTRTADREERIESALLHEALVRRLGPTLRDYRDHRDVPGEVSVIFGRASRLWGRGTTSHGYPAARHLDLPYWTDPAFRLAARREIAVQGLDDACRTVAAWHARGRAAFVKATRPKFFAQRVAPGTTLREALDSLAYSLCDVPDCLIVQEAVAMHDEYRIFVVDGDAVTGCGCVEDRTPADNRSPFDPAVATTRGTSPVRDDPALAEAYRRYAEAFLKGRSDLTCTLDLAIIDGRIGVVEMNPLHLGSVGLYACDLPRLVDRVLVGLGATIPSATMGTSTPLWA